MSFPLFLILFVMTLIVSVIFTAIALKYLRQFGFWNALDSQRKKPVVRGGGIAVAATFVLCGYISCLFFNSGILPLMNAFLPALFVLLLTGLVDDKVGITPGKKLLLQMTSVFLLWLCGFQIHFLLNWELSPFISAVVTVFWGTAILNAFNLIDGMDGLCTGKAFLCFVALGIMGFSDDKLTVTICTWLLCGCCLGFLFFNFHPAKIFLGDTGSLFLGLTCTMLSLRITSGEFNYCNTASMLMLFWIPFCDLGLAVWRRKVKAILKRSSNKVMERDMYHLHYRLQNLVHDHRRTVVIMWIGMFMINACSTLIFEEQSTILTLTLFIILCVISLVFFAQYELQWSWCLCRHTTTKIVSKLGIIHR